MRYKEKHAILIFFILASSLITVGFISTGLAQQSQLETDVSGSGSATLPDIPFASINTQGTSTLFIDGGQVDTKKISIGDGRTTSVQLSGDFTGSNKAKMVGDLGGNIQTGKRGELTIEITGQTINIDGQVNAPDFPILTLSTDATLELFIDGQTVKTKTITLTEGQTSTFSMTHTMSSQTFDSIRIQGTANSVDAQGQIQITTDYIGTYDQNDDGDVDGPEVRDGIKCFLFNTDCIGPQLNGTQVRTVIKAFLFPNQ